MSKVILIVGASYVGLTIAHKLLKNTLKNNKEYKIVLVNPSTHHYWNLASVRAIVPGQFSDDKIFADIAKGFTQYPAERFEFIVGVASVLNPSKKTVTISTVNGMIEVAYDIAVIATGSRVTGDAPWKGSLTGYETTKDNLHRTQEKVKTADSIVIGGGGPTGVESAGELGFEYGTTKKIKLITGANQLLAGVPANVVQAAENELKKLNVDVVKDVKIVNAKTSDSGKTELTLSSGDTITCDLYLPTVGVVVNTEWLSKDLLNDKGDLMVDEFLKVKNAPGIWAAGDVTDVQSKQFVCADKQAGALAKNLDLVINGKEPVSYKAGGPMMAVTLGRSKGTGHAGTMKLPSLVVWFAKGRTLGTQNLKGLVTGAST